MSKITIGFEGQTRDLDELFFSLFEAGMLREGLEKETPGDVKIVLGRMEMRKTAYAHTVMHIGLFVGQNVALPLFVAWLYDKWKKSGEKPITVTINTHLYQFDPDILIKGIEEAMRHRYSRRRVDSEQRLAEEILRFLRANPSDDTGEVVTVQGSPPPPVQSKLKGVTAPTLFRHFERRQTVTYSEIIGTLGILKDEGFVSDTRDRYSLTPTGTKEADLLEQP